MTEKLLHFVWRNKLFPKKMSTIDGQEIEIIHPGYPSFDSGADFQQARVKIGNKLWIGSVEIHINSSDWYKHKHDQNHQYRNVILHVVHKYDKPVYRPTGELMPTVVLEIPNSLQQNYERLYRNPFKIKCQSLATALPVVLKENWLSNLLIERLENRYNTILNLVEQNAQDWEQAFFIVLARAMGMKINAESFEQLAKNIDYKLLLRVSDDRFVLEAILYGQAGFLQGDMDDEYFRALKKEYEYQQLKNNLKPLPMHIWKFMRTRPYNYPTVRLSQLADIIAKHQRLFTYIREISEPTELQRLFDVKASEYWDNHYYFGKPSKRKGPKRLGKTIIQSILINTVAPFLYAYGRYMSEQKYINRAIELLEQLDFENNYITRQFKKLKFPSYNAADSQAQIQLYEYYCKRDRCFDCRIGSAILLDRY